MNRQFIFARTAKGELAMRTSTGIGPDEKRVMLLIDGVSNIETLSKKFPPSLQRQLDGIVSSLLKAGYIEEYVAGRRQLEGRLSRVLVFVRTAKGEVSLRTPGRIASDEKRVILLIDGTTNLDQLSKKLPPSLLGQLDDLIIALFKSGYIEEQSNRRGAMPLDSAEQTRLDYRAHKAELQEAIESSQQISANLLALAESEIVQRMAVEQELTETKALLLTAEAQLTETHLHYAQVEQQLVAQIESLQAQLGAISSLLGVTTPITQLPEVSPLHDMDDVLPPHVSDAPIKISPEITFTPTPYIDEIRDLAFFQGFSETELYQLVGICTWQEVPAESALITEDEPSQMFYVLISGKVRRVRHNRTVGFLAAGESFGEISYLKSETFPPIESIITRTKSVLLSIDPASLNQSHPALRLHLAEAFMRVQSQRMNETLSNLLI